MCGVGIIKGPVRRYCDHEIARHTEKLKKIEARRKPLEREVRELEQEQFQLTQLFKAEQSAQEPRKGAPPSVGGIPLAT
jgi:chromosome segregation ATPase